MRSSLHPELFAGVYLVAAKLATLCGLSLPSQAELLIAAPKVAQAVSAAMLDLYTWKLAGRVYGQASRTAFTTVSSRLFAAFPCLRSRHASISDIRICVTVACIVHMQSVAMVLLDSHAIQLR